MQRSKGVVAALNAMIVFLPLAGCGGGGGGGVPGLGFVGGGSGGGGVSFGVSSGGGSGGSAPAPAPDSGSSGSGSAGSSGGSSGGSGGGSVREQALTIIRNDPGMSLNGQIVRVIDGPINVYIMPDVVARLNRSRPQLLLQGLTGNRWERAVQFWSTAGRQFVLTSNPDPPFPRVIVLGVLENDGTGRPAEAERGNGNQTDEHKIMGGGIRIFRLWDTLSDDQKDVTFPHELGHFLFTTRHLEETGVLNGSLASLNKGPVLTEIERILYGSGLNPGDPVPSS